MAGRTRVRPDGSRVRGPVNDRLDQLSDAALENYGMTISAEISTEETQRGVAIRKSLGKFLEEWASRFPSPKVLG